MATYLKGELADPNDNETIVVKSHRLQFNDENSKRNGSRHAFDNIDSCVFVVRNLKDAIVADFTRRSAISRFTEVYGHEINPNPSANASEKRSDKSDIDNTNSHTSKLNPNLILTNTSFWQDTKRKLIFRFHQVFIKRAETYCKKKYFLIIYEELLKSFESKVEIMTRLVDFINDRNPHLRLSDDSEIVNFNEECLKMNHEGSAHRKHGRSEILDPEEIFDRKEKDVINDLMEKFERIYSSHLEGGRLPDSYKFI